MGFNNVEIKAQCSNLVKMRIKLKELNARYEGADHQIDTYFKTKDFKLKLRQGNIENNLIFYDRQKKKGPKLSSIIFYKTEEDSGSLKEILAKVMGIDIIIDKSREIYWIDNVKFHLDQVQGLGEFMEIEAIDYKGTIGEEKLLEQCNHYLKTLGIKKGDLITNSYSDMLSIKQ